jgi:pilus assembly protein CpaF
MIASAIDVVVQVTRMSDGSRKITSVSEITGMEENVITMQEIFSFEKRGIGTDGRVLGTFKPSRIRPRFVERLKTAGIMLPADTFDKFLEVN